MDPLSLAAGNNGTTSNLLKETKPTFLLIYLGSCHETHCPSVQRTWVLKGFFLCEHYLKQCAFNKVPFLSFGFVACLRVCVLFVSSFTEKP